MFAAADCPIDMAVFTRYDLDRNVVTAYFSPRASELARIFGAGPCEKPTRDKRLSLSCGDAQAWDHFFPTKAHDGATREESPA